MLVTNDILVCQLGQQKSIEYFIAKYQKIIIQNMASHIPHAKMERVFAYSYLKFLHVPCVFKIIYSETGVIRSTQLPDKSGKCLGGSRLRFMSFLKRCIYHNTTNFCYMYQFQQFPHHLGTQSDKRFLGLHQWYLEWYPNILILVSLV